MPEGHRDRVPAPAPGPPLAAPPRAALPLGADGPTLIEHLARSPAEDRKAGIEDLHERVGNRQVSRMIAGE